MLSHQSFTDDKNKAPNGRVNCQGFTTAVPTKELELGFLYLSIKSHRSFSALTCSAPPTPSPTATQVPTLALPLSGAVRLQANSFTFMRLAFFICKVAGLLGGYNDLIPIHEKCRWNRAWSTRRMH